MKQDGGYKVCEPPVMFTWLILFFYWMAIMLRCV